MQAAKDAPGNRVVTEKSIELLARLRTTVGLRPGVVRRLEVASGAPREQWRRASVRERI
jgi:hypothetical protein